MRNKRRRGGEGGVGGEIKEEGRKERGLVGGRTERGGTRGKEGGGE